MHSAMEGQCGDLVTASMVDSLCMLVITAVVSDSAERVGMKEPTLCAEQ